MAEILKKFKSFFFSSKTQKELERFKVSGKIVSILNGNPHALAQISFFLGRLWKKAFIVTNDINTKELCEKCSINSIDKIEEYCVIDGDEEKYEKIIVVNNMRELEEASNPVFLYNQKLEDLEKMKEVIIEKQLTIFGFSLNKGVTEFKTPNSKVCQINPSKKSYKINFSDQEIMQRIQNKNVTFGVFFFSLEKVINNPMFSGKLLNMIPEGQRKVMNQFKHIKNSMNLKNLCSKELEDHQIDTISRGAGVRREIVFHLNSIIKKINTEGIPNDPNMMAKIMSNLKF